MKFVFTHCLFPPLASLPVWGAWIEIAISRLSQIIAIRRSPCGERGLKSVLGKHPLEVAQSLPVWGAWIEILL